jgi:hypothetical protein
MMAGLALRNRTDLPAKGAHIRTFLLELQNYALRTISGDALKLTGWLSWLKASHLHTRATATGGSIIPPGNLSFAKRTLTGWKSGSWTQKVWDRFGWRPPHLGLGRLCPIGIIPTHLRYNWGKYGRTALRHLSWCRVCRVIRGSVDCTAEHQSSSFNRGTSAFHGAEIRGSPHQLNFCRSSQGCGRWKTEEFSSYFKENTTLLHYKDEMVYAVQGIITVSQRITRNP